MTLYLKYRPLTFADVVGQDQIVVTLESALRQDQLAHAYLFCGTRGTGKTSVARILSKAILTRGVEDATLQEQIIRGIEDGSFVDLIEIDAASNRRIDDVRELIERIQFSPVVSRAKVYIIDEVHMLTKEAFNALLKTLEEPPDYAYFILATTELHKVPDTIQSRCQRFLFKSVREEDLIRRLQYIVDMEHISIDREALRLIANHATGSFRDAISLLDQMRSLEHIGIRDIEERTGASGSEFVQEIMALIATENVTAIPGIMAKLEEGHIPLDHVLGGLLSGMRLQMHAAIERGESPMTFLPTMELLLKALQDLRFSLIPALVVESALLSLCAGRQLSPAPEPESGKKKAKQAFSVASAKLVEELARPEKEAVLDTVATMANTPEQSKPTLIEAEELTIRTVMQHWENVLNLVSPPHVKMSLKNASVSAAGSGVITLAFPSTFHRDKVADLAASRSIEDILCSIFKRPIRLKCSLEQPNVPRTDEPTSDLLAAAEEVFGDL